MKYLCLQCGLVPKDSVEVVLHRQEKPDHFIGGTVTVAEPLKVVVNPETEL